jgi:hypothetical protein
LDTGSGHAPRWLDRDGELRRTLVPAEPPADADAGEWARRYAELAGLSQLFIEL